MLPMTDKQKDEKERCPVCGIVCERANERIAELEALVASNIVVHDQEADGPTASLLEHLRAERDRYKEALETIAKGTPSLMRSGSYFRRMGPHEIASAALEGEKE